jgi:hypothetical protein
MREAFFLSQFDYFSHVFYPPGILEAGSNAIFEAR